MKCTALCSRAEYSVYDIKEKLYKWGVESREQNEVIEYLCGNNYINEERYAKCFVSEKFRLKHWGRVKIAYALRQKRIADEYIYSAFDNIDEEVYFNTLKEIIRSKSKGKIKDFNIKSEKMGQKVPFIEVLQRFLKFEKEKRPLGAVPM